MKRNTIVLRTYSPSARHSLVKLKRFEESGNRKTPEPGEYQVYQETLRANLIGFGKMILSSTKKLYNIVLYNV